ncbi:MAG: zinc-ribbon domain-containing protein [Deltaproteobacteria bacterium]|nr:zinc-ribbon domain-containing protein [Deltaproteobacteria bacterium]MBW2017391.1 zinc-ribbon domain-containing protein [Deltaproteobacteria bacterium]MBW2129434.1 zinc-ribbon domain-containing protein [Deltaproteobacteria bacterium]MBW2302973.1 zinc-ribbon domain-containing protein [Deltaproteobacteria bacterium]
MEVTCEHCGVKIKVPDEKIPRDKRIKLTCPKCGQKFPLPSPRGPQLDDLSQGGQGADREPDSYGYRDYAEDEELVFFEEGTLLALVLENNPEHLEKITGALKELGYQCIPAPDTRDATGKMRFHRFDLVILSDGFDGQTLERSPVLNYLNRMSMSVRRRMFVALLGDRFKTMDHMMAFAMSANVVINKKDLERLTLVLKKAVSENDKFYKIFMDELRELGKI